MPYCGCSFHLILPYMQSSPPPYSKDMCLIVPVYTSPTREKMIVSLSIPTADSVLLQSAPMLTLKL